MKPPSINRLGQIPETTWCVMPDGGRKNIANLGAYAQELDRVAKWVKAEAQWARWKKIQLRKKLKLHSWRKLRIK